MKPFLERFYSEVVDLCGDPANTARITREQLRSYLDTVDRAVFNQLLKSSLQESILGFAEADITIKSGQSRYVLPHGFRNFLYLVKKDSEGRVEGRLMSKPIYGTGYGVEILSSDRGFKLVPAPLLTSDEVWTIGYQRAPGPSHFAKALDVTENTVRASEPGSDAGTLIRIPHFYNGCILNIYEAKFGAPQSRAIRTFDAREGVFHLEVPFDPIPSGEVWYEVTPTLPYPEDGLYALDVAMLILKGSRRQFAAANELKDLRHQRWNSALEWVSNNVSDRGPARIKPLRPEDLMPSGEIPWWTQ